MPVVEPRAVALEVLQEVPLPTAQVRMNPALGLVGLPSWFWVEGYDGRPISSARTVDAPPLVGDDVPFDVVPADDPRRRAQSFTVEVRLWPTTYEWSFGDGSTIENQSLGRAYPRESDVQHTYDNSSLGPTGSFQVHVSVEFAAEYRVNGGPAQPLAATRRTYQGSYRVQEIQTVLAAM